MGRLMGRNKYKMIYYAVSPQTKAHTHLTAVEVMGRDEWCLLLFTQVVVDGDCPMNNIRKKKCRWLEKEREKKRKKKEYKEKVYKVGSGLLHKWCPGGPSVLY